MAVFPYSTPLVTIASGASLSASIYIGAGEPEAVEMPGAWDAAVLTFQASIDGTTFLDLYDDAGNEVALAVQPNQHVAIGEGGAAKTEHFRGVTYMKIRSGTAGAPVNQGAARTLTLVIKKSLTGTLA